MTEPNGSEGSPSTNINNTALTPMPPTPPPVVKKPETTVVDDFFHALFANNNTPAHQTEADTTTTTTTAAATTELSTEQADSKIINDRDDEHYRRFNYTDIDQQPNEDMEEEENDNKVDDDETKKRKRVLDEFDEYSLLSSNKRKSTDDISTPIHEARDIIQAVNNNQNDTSDDEEDDNASVARQILSRREIDWSTVKPESRMLIRRLPRSIEKQDVMTYFSKYGEVLEVVQKSPFGFVHFENPQACAQAVQIENGKVFHGIVLELEICKRKPFFARAAEREAHAAAAAAAKNGLPYEEPRVDYNARRNSREQARNRQNNHGQSPPPRYQQQNRGAGNNGPRRPYGPDLSGNINGRNNNEYYRSDFARNNDYGRDNNDYGRNNNYNRNNNNDYTRNNDYGRNNNDYNRNDYSGRQQQGQQQGYGYGRNNELAGRGGYNGYNNRGGGRYNDDNDNRGGRYNNEPNENNRYIRYDDQADRGGYREQANNNDRYSHYPDNRNDYTAPAVQNLIPRHGEIPVVQIISWDTVSYGFTDFIERTFTSNHIRASSITLPYSKNSRDSITKQMIIEGVKAIVMIDHNNEAQSKIYLQVFAPAEHGQGVRYDEYDSVTAAEAVSIIRRSHSAVISQPVAQQNLHPLSMQQQAPQQTQQPAIDMNALASLYSAIQQPKPVVSPTPPVNNQASVQQLLATLVSSLGAPAAAAAAGPLLHQYQTPVQQQMPAAQQASQQPNIAALISTAAGGNPALAQLLAQMTANGNTGSPNLKNNGLGDSSYSYDQHK